jgi:hypothetical protein
MTERYPGYDVLAKWDSPSFDATTRGVISRRLKAAPPRRFFTPEEFRAVEAIAARLTAQDEVNPPIPVAPWIDADLFDERGGGFRHADAPPDREIWRIGLAGIRSEARRRHALDFADLAPDLQDAVLGSVQSGDVAPSRFADVSPSRIFKAMLNAVVGVYYAHPAAWNEIGFGGPASPRGYVRIGLDERDPWEAQVAPERGGP